MDYYGPMVQTLRLRAIAMAVAIVACAHSAWAQAPAQPELKNSLVSAADEASAEDEKAAVNAELFYEILVGEMTTNQGDPASGYALYLDAARRSGESQLYRRATEIALQSRSAESALIAARAWKSAFPDSQDANRYLLQILVILNRIDETGDLLKQEITQSSPRVKLITLRALPQIYGHVSNKAQAASIVESAVANELSNPAVGPTAWTTIGRMRLAANNPAGALDAAKQALKLDRSDEGAGMLILLLLEQDVPGADKLIEQYLAGTPGTEVRLAYARMLLQARRNSEAREQLEKVTQSNPEIPDSWLVLASLNVQAKQLEAADNALHKYIELSEPKKDNPTVSKALTRAYLLGAQIAVERKNFPKAQDWLTRAERNEPGDFSVNLQQASLLAREGKLAQARAMIKNLPAKDAEDNQRKLLAEVQVLKDAKDFKEAAAVMGQASALTPEDNDLVYEQAMLAEKAGDLDGMEQLLRKVIARQPDYHHAHNALGYSLADRGVRLQEAKELITHALKSAPEDPFITDSLAWVEFRLGNVEEAARLFEKVYAKQQDAEIAAHFGEVLWKLGQRDRAIKVWREGMASDATNETLLETVKRLGVRL